MCKTVQKKWRVWQKYFPSQRAFKSKLKWNSEKF